MSVSPSPIAHLWRHRVLWLLLAVLPLQSLGSLAGWVQGQRHIHVQEQAQAKAPARSWALAVHAMLAPPPTLSTHELGVRVLREEAAHANGAWGHRHGLGEPGVIVLGEAGDESGQGAAAAAFLAWLPAGWSLPLAGAHVQLAAEAGRWQDHLRAPPRTPPRRG